MDYRVTVTGDAEHGWIVDIHDGDHQGVYSPEGAADAEAAAKTAMDAHFDKYGTRPKTEEPPPAADVPPAV